MKKNKGFTLQEVLLALVVLAVVFSLTVSTNKNVSKTTNMAIKKANKTLTDVVQNLLDDLNYYNEEKGFADLTEIRLPNGKPVGDESKFRELFGQTVVLNGRLKSGEILLCPVLQSQGRVVEQLCYKTEDGIVWGIPDTDFRTRNIVKMIRKNYETSYAPITVYVDCAFDNSRDDNGIIRCKKSDDPKKYFDDYAVVFGVRQDGDIRPYSEFNCGDPTEEKRLQCRLAKIISDTSF